MNYSLYSRDSSTIVNVRCGMAHMQKDHCKRVENTSVM